MDDEKSAEHGFKAFQAENRLFFDKTTYLLGICQMDV